MANYTTSLSFTFDLRKSRALELLRYISCLEDAKMNPGAPGEPHPMNLVGWPDPAEILVPFNHSIGFEVSITAPEEAGLSESVSVWVRGDECPNVEMIAWLMQETMQRFNIHEPIMFEWADVCSSLRPDSFGGGVAVIGRDRAGTVTSKIQTTNGVGQEMLASVQNNEANRGWYIASKHTADVVRKHDGGWIELSPETLDQANIVTADYAAGLVLPEGSLFVRPDLIADVPVVADVHSDDQLVRRDVDVRPWLLEASIDELAELAAEDWSFCEAADRVAYGLEALREPGCVALFSYLNLNPESLNGDQVGFGVSLDGASCHAWLAENRPEVHEELLSQLGSIGPAA